MLDYRRQSLPDRCLIAFGWNQYMKFIFLSLFKSGNLPMMPGTWGSLLSAIIFGLVWFILPIDFSLRFVVLIAVFTVVYSFAVRFIREIVDDCFYDKQWIVIDEFIGMMIACLPFFFAQEFSWLLLIIGFVLFRLFDIWKPLGIKKIDKLNTPNSVILDDVLAGVYALVIQLVIVYFFFSDLFLL